LILEAALNLAGTKAASANIHLTSSAVLHNGNTLNIGRPGALGLAVGMADQITGHSALVADFAELTHASHLLFSLETEQSYSITLISVWQEEILFYVEYL